MTAAFCLISNFACPLINAWPPSVDCSDAGAAVTLIVFWSFSFSCTVVTFPSSYHILSRVYISEIQNTTTATITTTTACLTLCPNTGVGKLRPARSPYAARGHVQKYKSCSLLILSGI